MIAAALLGRLIVLALLLSAPVSATARKLGLQHFTPRDGLAGNTVHSIVSDSRGLLWFCTNDGLSRFDGREFLTFGSEHGLGDQEVFHILETADGNYWVGTARGISRMDLLASDPARVGFRNYLPAEDRRSQWIQRLLQDRTGHIWIATNGGLYRMTLRSGQPVFEHVPLTGSEQNSSPRLLALAVDKFGKLWAGGDRGLFLVDADGRAQRYSVTEGLPSNLVLSLSTDVEGNLWVGLNGGLCRLKPKQTVRAKVDRVFRAANGLPDEYVFSVLPSSNWLWAGTLKGLVRLPLADAGGVKVFTLADGLSHTAIEALAEGSQRDLWIGTMGGGASRLVTGGFTTFGVQDGLASREITGMLETEAGDFYAVSTDSGSDLTLNRFADEHFVPVRPRFPRGIDRFGWGWAQTVAHDRYGQWWVATSRGVVRFSRAEADKLANIRASAVLRTNDQLPEGTVFRVFADSHGDIWISTSGDNSHGLMRWRHDTGAIERFDQAAGMPGPAADDRSLASAFAEDASGTVWVGFHRGGLFRVRSGSLVQVRPDVAVAPEGVRWIHRDRRNRLWIAGRKGLLRVDRPEAEEPIFRHYGSQSGLSSNFLLSIAEDHTGRIFVGSARGVDRLDPETGFVRNYGREDGLVGGEIRVAHADTGGNIWFGSAEGISRYDPHQEQPLAPPTIYISQLRLGRYTHDLAPTGAEHVSVRPLSWRHNALHVGFMGLGPGLRYQYLLEGVDTDWSEPGLSRSVTYPGLPARAYRFLVRAVNTEGTPSSRPATVEFRIKPQIWATWWFRMLAVSVIAASLLVLHRARVARAVAVERLRRRISRDLHDDLGAGLCQAALLSDLVQQDASIGNATAQQRLARISAICREALDSMADIVWAINPEKDNASDLVRKMRVVGEEAAASRDVQFSLIDEGLSDSPLGPQIRHDLYLLFKEAVHNAVRHSGATLVQAELYLTDHRGLTLRVIDNGRGMSQACMNPDGNGLRSMSQRASACGGSLRICSSEGGGTSLEVHFPLAPRRSWSIFGSTLQ